jgi:hypothetical protein
MGWQHITNQNRDRLLALYADKLNPDRMKILTSEASLYGMQITSLIRRLQEHNQTKIIDVSKDERRVYNGHLRVETDDAIIISDMEICDEHRELMALVAEVGEVYGVKKLFWGGDMLKQDNPGIASHTSHLVWEVQEPTFEENIERWKTYLRRYNQVFDDQYIMPGNHDVHMSWKTGGAMWYGMLVSEMPKITVSRYPYMNIKTRRKLIRLTHQRDASYNMIGLGNTLINSKSIKSDIIMAHSHVSQVGFSADGQHRIISLPCMRDPLRTQYKQLIDTKHGEWNLGFFLMLDSYYYPLDFYETNWDRVLSGKLG